MYRLWITPSFHRKMRKLKKKDRILEKKIEKALSKLRENPNHASLRTHHVGRHRKYGTVWGCWVTGDVRVKWAYDKARKQMIVMLQIGGHDDVYRKSLLK